MLFLLLSSLFMSAPPQDVPSPADVGRALQAGKLPEAEALATKLIAADDTSAIGYLLRGTIRDAADKLPGAIEDFTAALNRKIADRDKAGALDRRGSANFKAGRIKESIDDFDAFIRMRPDSESQHWRRGISYYYVGRFDEGRKQFEAYQRVDGNDVENVFWRAMCTARKDGLEKAQANLAPVGVDRRVPMMTIYKLIKGAATPEDVLKDARSPAPSNGEMKQRLFYAYLYIGLYAEIKGDKAAAKENLKKAVDVYPLGPYMWAVARTHLKLLEKPSE